MKKIQVYLPDKLLSDLKEIAATKGISLSEVIRRKLDGDIT